MFMFINKMALLHAYRDLTKLFNKNNIKTQNKIINLLKSSPSLSDGKGWVYGYKLPGDINLRTNLKIKLGRTQRPDPYKRIVEQKGEMIFCTSSNWNRKLERIIHLFFKYSNIHRDNHIEWFHFTEKINVEKIVCQIKELVDDQMDTVVQSYNQPIEVPNKVLIKVSKININLASKYELMKLPGIGQALSERIIKYRSMQRFNAIEDLMLVPYIKIARFEPVRNLVSV